ncbi:MAG TPA: FKBP-type peptidyl-prolyl cis-trans isomerase [Opitutaceae bacterium]|nr:FKBP-type peptidyl-prolyl cis-trans isomerase [Opitutaceae bacterium]
MIPSLLARSWSLALLGGILLGGVPPAVALTDHMPKADAEIVAKLLPDAVLLDGGIRFVEKQKGQGLPITRGDVVTALYIGRLLDGKIFNQKQSRNHSFTFEVGADPRQIILGWEQALRVMQNGGRYVIAIPAELAYRDYGRPGQVPPHATVIFEMEILEVQRRKR